MASRTMRPRGSADPGQDWKQKLLRRTSETPSSGGLRTTRPPRRWRTRLLRGVGFLFALTVLQVLYVRFLPPLTTLTMLERQGEAYAAGKSAALQRDWVDLEEVSPEVLKAVLAGEDARFYEHNGFDWQAIQKAWEHNQKSKRVRGASTLSQQTARNLFCWQKRSWLRKGLETYYTVLLELLVPKDRILELYLNVAEWGDRIFGVEAAAQHYFKKSARKLSRKEAAALSASLPNPRKFPPDGSTKFQRRRQALILERMDAIKPGETSRAEVEEEGE